MEGALFLNVVSAGIFVGVQLLVLESVAPVIRKQERALSIRLHRELLDHKEHVRIPMPTTSLAILTAVALLFLDISSTARILLGVGLVGMLGISITTFGFNGPMNVRVRTMAEDSPEYDTLARRWDRAHALRAASGLLALLAFVAAALSR